MTWLARSLLALTLFLAFIAGISVKAQTATTNAGVVVISVSKSSEAEKAGIRNGDIIVGWAQADQEGTIASPLDLRWVEREWAPRGSVVITARRDGVSMRLTLSSPSWGISAGPRWPEVNPVYLRIKELADADQFDRVAEYCRSACAQVSEDLGARSWLFSEAANSLGKSEQWKEADEFYGRAIQASPDSAPYQRPLIYEEWAEGYRTHRDLSTAGEHYMQALVENQKTNPESLAVAYDCYKLAFVRFNLSDVPEAERFAIEALHIRRKLCPNTLQVAEVLNYLGVFAQQNGDLDSAEDYLRQSLSLAERLNPNGHEAAFADNNLGAVADKRGDLAAAEKYYLRDLEISSRLNPDDYQLSYSWANLGTIAFQRGNLVRARQYDLKALAIQEGPEHGKDLAMTLNNLAGVFEENGELSDAEKLLRRAVGIQEEVAPASIELGETLDTLGTVLRKQRRFEEAQQTLSRALELRQKTSPDSLEVAETLHHLGEVDRDQRNFGKAEKQFAAAAQIRRRLAPSSASYAESMAALAELAQAQLRWEVAATNYEKAINVLDGQSAVLGGSNESRFRFHAKYANYYSQYVSVLMQEGRVARAFEVLERSRGRTLLEMLAEGDIKVRTGISPALLAREERLKSRVIVLSDQRLRTLLAKHTETQVAEMDQKIADLLSEIERVRAEIRADSPRYAALTQPKPLNLSEMQPLLDGETLLLEYSIGSESSYLFALTRNGLTWFGLPKRQAIDRLAKRAYRLWTSRNVPASENNVEPALGRTSNEDSWNASAELSDAVLGPVGELMKGYRRLIVVSDSGLQYIPFAGLPLPGPGSREARPYLMAEHEVVSLPSASILAMLRKESASTIQHYSKTVAIVADPVFSADDPRVGAATHSAEPAHATIRNLDGSDLVGSVADTGQESDEKLQLPRLLYSRAEADEIAAVVPKGQAYEALDFDASRATATSSVVLRSRILHFATHGFLDSRNPELSGLVFSLVDKSGHPEVGFVGLEDVFNASLRADLVVLSACQTALGEEVDGEGLVGLTWGFMYAGAKSVVASLWKVNDASTAELMRLFYEAMEQRDLSPADALRWAQLAMSGETRWADPYYWAGFVIQGDWASSRTHR